MGSFWLAGEYNKIFFAVMMPIERKIKMHDCRECVNWDLCPCGKTGHEKGTSIGFSIGECKDWTRTSKEAEQND